MNSWIFRTQGPGPGGTGGRTRGPGPRGLGGGHGRGPRHGRGPGHGRSDIGARGAGARGADTGGSPDMGGRTRGTQGPGPAPALAPGNIASTVIYMCFTQKIRYREGPGASWGPKATLGGPPGAPIPGAALAPPGEYFSTKRIF